ncbi:LacI family DNA-binding transcriptional regulator [Arthrobacter sp. MDT1-48-3]
MTISVKTTGPSTSLDVARLAGVSRSTVSNILNGNDARFPAATQQRVREAAKELDYRPSQAGRSLVSGRSDTIVILLPNTTFGSNLQDAVDEAVSTTVRLGGNVVVRFAGETPKLTFEAISALRPLAVLAFSGLPNGDRQRLEAAGTIVVPSQAPAPDALPDAGIGELQARLLLARGPRRLWFASLSDQRQDPYGPGRLSTLMRFCVEQGLPAPGHISVPLNVPGATQALEEVLASGLPAGVVCYNDDVALALLAAARVLKVEVPDTLSLVGLDNTPVGQLWDPPLTTIDTDLRGLVANYSADLEARLKRRTPPPAEPHRFQVIHGGTT